MEPDQHRSTLCDNLACRGGDWADVQWAPDSTSVAFVSTSRDHKQDDAARRRCRDRQRPRRARGDRRDVLRVGQRARQLAVPAGVERSDLVLRARQLGPALSVRPADRQAEAPDHQRRRQRHAAAARRREAPRCSSSRRSAARRAAIRTSRISTRSNMDGGIPALLTPEDADPRVSRCRRPATTSSTATRSPTCRRSPSLRDVERQADPDAREGGHLAAASRPAGSRRRRSR